MQSWKNGIKNWFGFNRCHVSRQAGNMDIAGQSLRCLVEKVYVQHDIKKEMDVFRLCIIWLLPTLVKLGLICGNKMPTRCNRGFYCRSYCLLNMFRAPLCPKLRVMCPVCRTMQHPANRTHNPQLHTRPATWKPKHEIPQAATTV